MQTSQSGETRGVVVTRKDHVYELQTIVVYPRCWHWRDPYRMQQ